MAIRNFKESLTRTEDGVVAGGPLGTGEKIKEICAWVIQTQPDGSDAAATEMESGERETERLDNPSDDEWSLELATLSGAKLESGTAFAAGMALIETHENGVTRERVSIWAELVTLEDPKAS